VFAATFSDFARFRAI